MPQTECVCLMGVRATCCFGTATDHKEGRVAVFCDSRFASKSSFTPLSYALGVYVHRLPAPMARSNHVSCRLRFVHEVLGRICLGLGPLVVRVEHGEWTWSLSAEAEITSRNQNHAQKTL